MRRLAAFRASNHGATAIEYGLIASLIGLAILGALTATGTSIGEQWKSWTDPVLAALGG